MSTIYFKTAKTSVTGKKIQLLIERGKEGKKQAEELCKELNAKLDYLRNDRFLFNTGLCAFKFENDPDPKFWKTMKDWPGFYKPRLITKFGRDLSQRIHDLEKVDRSEIGEAIGWDDFFTTPGFFFNKKATFFGFQIDSDWNHQMPADCIEITGTEYQNL